MISLQTETAKRAEWNRGIVRKNSMGSSRKNKNRGMLLLCLSKPYLCDDAKEQDSEL